MAAIFDGPGGGYNDKTATAGDKIGGKSGVAEAAAKVKGAGSGFGTFDTDSKDGDQDADDLPNSNGSADGHADCVPSGEGWPAIQK